ncbi:MAG: MFS transporter [Phenylobacterium sp.]|uniref:MFS transporter n=1 Tax=Phenylobacterium sp. TaxID=1871053 RepID=UPI0027254F2A|nr:MFS transporter [Phenylobacterium sp.]MDO8914053.1 MFS transporter [Phenylobacterium sp.]MDP2011976.1 MFS transporter [Phenylobacterium sp.]MDP3102655.1 MFS transporter [Phenylobacterium sp.]MDZ4051999.1 MFS transporter [Phenylobacterium sp.]HQT54762.1 MFS transporter [Phenylobacterium sp.]
MAQEKTRGGNGMVIAGASVGTVFEWYDFYLYGSLAGFITLHFFSGVNETTGYIFALLAFAAGFAVRPFGALVFGRLGDLWGRKNTFLVTMLLMGLSTFAVGLLPGYDQIGVAAPVLLIIMRLIQGLALGGEYGGAATYVAEHAPPGKRGLYTSWIQTTATLGLFLSLVVILLVRTLLGEEVFRAWAWRIPFLVSALLLGVSLWIRLKLNESPVFQKMIDEGTTSKKPLTESFGQWSNLKLVLLALAGLTAGQAVVWYTGQFYALFFLEKTLKLDGALANTLVAFALILGVPFFVVFGWLSDKIGRKPIIMLGCLLAALTYFPIFKALTAAANPALAAATASSPVTVIADPAGCAFQFDPVGKTAFTSSCDVAKSALATAGVSYANQAAPAGTLAVVKVGDVEVSSLDGASLSKTEFTAAKTAWSKTLAAELSRAGYPAKADSALVNKPAVVGLLFLLMFYVTMVYGPIAAALVEMFPARIRYTSMSLPYHIGNGWFGGFLPTTAFAMVAATGNIYYGLWYPIVIAAVTVVVGVFFVKEMRGANIDA